MPPYVSSESERQYDTLQVVFWGGENFKGLENDLPVNQGSVISVDIARQIPAGSEASKNLYRFTYATDTATKAVLIFTFVACLAVQDSLLPIWTLINTL